MGRVTCGECQECFQKIELMFELILRKFISFSLAERAGVLDRKSGRRTFKHRRVHEQKQAVVMLEREERY